MEGCIPPSHIFLELFCRFIQESLDCCILNKSHQVYQVHNISLRIPGYLPYSPNTFPFQETRC